MRPSPHPAPSPRRSSRHALHPGALRAGLCGRWSVARVRPVPAPVIQVVAVSHRGERHSDVVEHDVKAVAPPVVAADVEIVQYLLEVEAYFESDPALGFPGIPP